MWVKTSLAGLLALSIILAVHFEPEDPRTLTGLFDAASGRPRLRVMTWNIGYAALENDSRAHDEDLPAVAAAIHTAEPDVVALQELAGRDQLDILLDHLGSGWQGATGRMDGSDRVVAVLVKNMAARFGGFPTRRGHAVTATFTVGSGAESRDVVVASVHADAFNARRRRRYTEAVLDWAARQSTGTVVLLAGDFNFELDAENITRLFTDNARHDSEAYSAVLRHFRDFGRAAGDTALDERRIDYIFGPTDARLADATVLRGVAAGRMDHWPLMVELELCRPGEECDGA